MRDLFLVRHGESEGNVDPSKYYEFHDSEIVLTEKGREQAREAADTILELLGDRYYYGTIYDILVLHSPYIRTVQTKDEMVGVFKAKGSYVDYVREDPRLREREWGELRDITSNGEANDDHFGYFYKPNGGESFANVYDRCACVDNWMQTELYPLNKPTVLVAHGEWIKVFIQYKLGQTVKDWESVYHPANGQVLHLRFDEDGVKLNPKTPQREWKQRKHIKLH